MQKKTQKMQSSLKMQVFFKRKCEKMRLVQKEMHTLMQSDILE
jgi:hypothetical protein